LPHEATSRGRHQASRRAGRLGARRAILAAEGRPTSLLLSIFGLLVGLSAALAARAQLTHAARTPAWRSPHLLGALLYEVLAVTPVAIYLAFRHPGWSALYLAESWSPWALGGLLLLAPAGLATVGFLGGAALVKRDLLLPARGLAALCGLGLLGLAGWAAPRLLRVAEGQAWAEAPGPSGELAATLAFALPVLLAGWVFLLALSWVEGRKLLRMLAFQREARGAEPSAPALPAPAAGSGRPDSAAPGF